MMQSHIKGFTLVELMIVITIIGVLSAIAIPAYQDYVSSSADDACLAEASGYAQQSFANIQLDRTVTDPIKNACKTMDTASAMTATTLGIITATPKTPGKATITCDLTKGASCTKS